MLKNKKGVINLIFIFISIMIIHLFNPLILKAHGPLDGFNFSYSIGNDGKADFKANVDNSIIKDDIEKETFVNKIFGEGKGVIMGIFGVSMLTMVVLAILSFIKLGKSSGNPTERSQALKGLLYLGIAMACLGGVTIFVGVSYGLLR